MSKIFIHIANMSISAGYAVIAVLLLRLIFKKAPKWLNVAIWGIVALRLVIPFSFESIFSIIPSGEVISPNIMTDRNPSIYTGIPLVDTGLNYVIEESFTPQPGESVNPLQIWIPIVTYIWLSGVILMLSYLAVSYARVKRKVSCAVLYKENIYQADSVSSPFVLGFFKPKIYVPFNMDEGDLEYVIAHERAHIRRKDYIWKPLGFVLLTVYWFNPLFWIAYVLLCRDIEFACDEKVIKELSRDERADYSEALLKAGANRRMIAACPLAFGEVGVKGRIKSVLNYKRPAFWIIITALIACLVFSVCLLTNPKDSGPMPPTSYTDFEGIYITVEFPFEVLGIDDKKLCVDVIWHNETNREASFGELFYVEYEESPGVWINTANGDGSFILPAYTLSSRSKEEKKYSTFDFDLSREGNYRFRIPFSVKENGEYKPYCAYAEFKIGLDYSEYLGLDASRGLDVYVWQMSKGSYSFGLLPHKDEPRQWISDELMNLVPADAEDMREILATYNVEEDKIYIIPWQNPLSSYIGEYWLIREGEDVEAKRAAYIGNIRDMLSLK